MCDLALVRLQVQEDKRSWTLCTTDSVPSLKVIKTALNLTAVLSCFNNLQALD